MSRAKAYRQKVQESLTEVTVPSGAVFLVREYNPEGWLMSGDVPQPIVQTYLDVQKRGEVGMAEMLEEPGTFKKLGDLMRFAVCYCSVDPIVKIDPKGEDELAASDILFGDLQYLWLYLTKQLPDSTVRTETGGVSAEAVHTFREGGRGETAPGDSGGGSEVRDAAELFAGAV